MNSEIEEKIKGWFYKSEPDYFSSFTTRWIAFNAYYKACYQLSKGSLTEYTNRRGVEEIKESEEHYELVRKLVKGDKDFRRNLRSLTGVLKDQPLQNMRNSHDLLSLPEEPVDRNSDIAFEFYKELVEIIYTIRNNLFHGDKEIISKRDRKLVKLAYKILHGFMSEIIGGNFAIMRQSK